WEFKDDAQDAEPLIFHTWMDGVETLLYKDEIPDSRMDLFEGSGQTTDEPLRKGADSSWMKEDGGLEEVLRVALENTVDKLIGAYGETVTEWEWRRLSSSSVLPPAFRCQSDSSIHF